MCPVTVVTRDERCSVRECQPVQGPELFFERDWSIACRYHVPTAPPPTEKLFFFSCETMVAYQKDVQKETSLDVQSGRIQESPGFNLDSEKFSIATEK